MIIRRLGAGLTAAGLGLAWVGVAAAPAVARAPSVSFSSPGAGATVKDSSPTIAGAAEATEGVIVEVVVTMSSPDGHPVPAATRITGDNRQNVSFSMTPSLPYNGRYSVSARATAEDKPVDTNGAESTTVQRDFNVEAPPQRPTGVKATLDEQTRIVTVSWRPNAESDMVGYQVQRAVGDSPDWAVAGQTPKTRTEFEDTRTAEQGGDYRYRVVAIRQGATADTGVTSEASSAVSITVPEPPKTTPTTAASRPDQGPTGDGDGSGSTGGSAGGSTGSGSAGGSGSGSSGSGSSSGGSIGPVITRSQKVDLSGFTMELDRVQAPKPTRSEPTDPGYEEALPFGAVTEDVEIDGEEGDEVGAAPMGFDREADRRQAFTFLAAGLLATVLLMHMLWLKGEVDRVPLEALPAEGPGLSPAVDAPRFEPVPAVTLIAPEPVVAAPRANGRRRPLVADRDPVPAEPGSFL